jgi:hypothetical protein
MSQEIATVTCQDSQLSRWNSHLQGKKCIIAKLLISNPKTCSLHLSSHNTWWSEKRKEIYFITYLHASGDIELPVKINLQDKNREEALRTMTIQTA